MADASPVCGGVLADAKCDVRKSKTATKNSTARLMHWIMTTIPGDNLIGRTTIQLARQPRTRRGQGASCRPVYPPNLAKNSKTLVKSCVITFKLLWRFAGDGRG